MSFNHNWKEAGRQPEPTDELLGRWQGTCSSDANGHNGQLRCIVTKKDDGTFEAQFHAKYRKVLTFGYTVPLTAKREGKTLTFKGEANLGRLAGGVYHYDGEADGTNFFSTYRCKCDHGTFQMKRVTK